MWRLNEKNDKGQEGSGYLHDGPAPCPDGGNIDWSGIQPFHYKTSFVFKYSPIHLLKVSALSICASASSFETT